MLEPLLFTSSEDKVLCKQLIADIFLHKEHRPLGSEFPREGLSHQQAITFGSFERSEGKATIRYQITNENGYRGVELRYLLKGTNFLFDTDTMDWELKI